MRSGLQPVAISCNQIYYHVPFAPPGDNRALSENASDAWNVLGKPIYMQDCELRTIGVLRSSAHAPFGRFALAVYIEHSWSRHIGYSRWCERVRSAYPEGARDPLYARLIVLRPERVARAVFGAAVAGRAVARHGANEAQEVGEGERRGPRYLRRAKRGAAAHNRRRRIVRTKTSDVQ